jgi:hypothetical protein
MANISEILKTTVQKLPNALFIRATDDDANIELDNISISGRTVFLYHNLPRVGNEFQKGGLSNENYPTEIDVLQLADFDDNTRDSDAIREECKVMSDRLMDQLKVRTDSVRPIAGYEQDYSGSVKVHDVILTGLRLRFNWPFDREVYYCG